MLSYFNYRFDRFGSFKRKPQLLFKRKPQLPQLPQLLCLNQLNFERFERFKRFEQVKPSLEKYFQKICYSKKIIELQSESNQNEFGNFKKVSQLD